MKIVVGDTPQAAADLAAEAVADAFRASTGRFTFALSGGSTPRMLYETLAKAPAIDWSRIQVILGDERCVPADHEHSNFGMAWRSLLDRVPIPPANVHRVPCDHGDAKKAAKAYDAVVRELAPVDLVLLGMGGDGHTASLFPPAPAGGGEDALVIATVAPPKSPIPARVTLGYRAIREARRVLLLVTGKDKAARLAEVVRGAAELPMSKVLRDRSSDVDLYLDAAAASDLVKEK